MKTAELEIRSYCNNMTEELDGWKSKMYDLVSKLDRMSTGAKEKVVPEVNELHMIIEELSDRIDRLRKECPTSWKAEHSEIENRLGHVGRKIEDVIDVISPSDVGG